MRTSNVLSAGAGLILGTGLGFFVGYFVMKKEVSKLYDAELMEMDQKIKALQDMIPEKAFEDNKKSIEKKVESKFKSKEPSKRDMPDPVDYTKFTQKISEMNYEYEQNVIADPADSIAPSDEDDDIDENVDEQSNDALQEEMYYEQLKNYKDIHGDDILILGDNQLDEDFPDLTYDAKDLYWFAGDNVVTDDEGNLVNEEETIGSELRKRGWVYKSNKDTIWVRNNSDETDYCIYKYAGTSTNFFVLGKEK